MPMPLLKFGPAGLTQGSAQIHTYRRGISIRARVQLPTSQRSDQAGQVRDLHPWKRNLATILATQIRAAQESGISRSVEWETFATIPRTRRLSSLVPEFSIFRERRRLAMTGQWSCIWVAESPCIRTGQLPGSGAGNVTVSQVMMPMNTHA